MDDATQAGPAPAADGVVAPVTEAATDAATGTTAPPAPDAASGTSMGTSVGLSSGTVSGLPSPADVVEGAASATTRRRRHRPRRQRPGDLTTGWATALGCAWLLAVIALAGVWVSSRTTGLSTWWLGPEARPASPLVTALPFIAPLAATIATFWGVRRAPWIGLTASVATAAIGVGDLGRVTAYGIVELVVAGATLVVSVASFAGMYRSPATAPDAAAPATAPAPSVGADAER